MTTFPVREEAYERKFVLDQELEFKAKARRDHLLGRWAAAKLGFAGPAVEDYANELVVADVEAHDVVDKVSEDFAAHGVAQSKEQIRRTMAELMSRSLAEIKAGR